MMLRSRLTLLFVAAVQVTFVTAVAAYWGLQSWRLAMDEMAGIHAQHRRLAAVIDRFGTRGTGRGGGAKLRRALDGLRANAQTVDESDRITALATAADARSLARARIAARRLDSYYETEHARLRARSAFLARVSKAILAGIVGLIVASFLAFLAAIRAWFVVPVRALEQATEIMSSGNLSHRIAVRGDDELARLGAAVNHMAASLALIQAQLITSERFALLGELAAYVAHNIRNPLASIRATAQAESLDLPDTDPRRAALEDIVRAVDRLGAWVTDLLRSVSPVALERRPGSVSELVSRCVELARPRLYAAGIDVQLAAPPTPAVAFDEAKLEQVVSAILSNATDASPRGGRIGVHVDHDAGTVALSIADDGNGVPASRRDRLFTPFATSKRSGTGLGLWLSQKIVVAHGGTITLREREGGGTTVEVRLPVVGDVRWPAF